MRKAYNFKRLTEMVKHFAVLMLITVMAAGNLFADEVTFVFSEAGVANGQLLPDGTLNGIISYSGEKQSSSNDGPKYYTSGSALRFYAGANSTLGNALVLTPAFGYQITGLTINALNTYTPEVGYVVDGGESLLVNAGEDNVYTITGIEAASSLKFYNAGTAQLRATSITITYTTMDVPAVAAPAFSHPSGVYTTPFSVSLTCATPGANILYKFNDSEFYVPFESPVLVNTTTTIHAFAVLGEDTSAMAHVTYEFPQIVSLATFTQGVPGTLYALNPISAKMEFVFRDGRNVYFMNKNTEKPRGLLVYDNNPAVVTTQYEEGEMVDMLLGTLSIYNGLPEMIPTADPGKSALSAPHAVVPEEATVAQILANPEQYLSSLVILRNGQFEAGTFTTSSKSGVQFIQGTDTILIYNNFKTVSAVFEGGEKASVVGLVGLYNGVPQIYPRGNNDLIRPQVPFTCNFEGSDSYYWTLANSDSKPNNWYIGNANNMFDNNKLYIDANGGLSNVYQYNNSSVAHAYIDITLPESDVLLQFDCKTVGNAEDYLQVSIMDENPVNGILPSSYLARFYNVNETTRETILIPASYAGNRKIVFTWRNDNAIGNQTPAVIDNITLETTCTMVSNITATVENHTAVITWDYPEGQNAWTLQYKAADADAWQSVNTTTPSVTLNNLSTETTYDVRVRSNCEAAASGWKNAQFTVPCINLVLTPVDFTIGTGTSSSYIAPMNAYYGNSWTQMIYPASNFASSGYINALSWEVSSANAHDYNSLKIYLGTTTMNAHSSSYDWVPMEDLTLVYESNNGTVGSSAGWETYLLNNSYYYNNEENLVVVVSRAANGWKSLNYYYTNVSGSCLYRRADGNASYAEHPGTASGTVTYYLPNMAVNYVANVCGDEHCAAPTEVNVFHITTNSATISWDANGANSWKLMFKEEDSENWTALTISQNHFELTDLEQNTNYVVRVMADCGVNGLSDEVAVAFTTVAACPASTDLSVEHHLNNTVVSWMPVPGVNTYDLQYAPVGATLWVSNLVNNASSFVLGGLTEGETYKVRVRSVCDAEEGVYSEWTELTFTRPAYCNTPENLTISNITNNSAKVTWDTLEATSWTVQYGEAGFTVGAGIQVTVASPSVVLTGLNSQTAYEVYVKANCGVFPSVWSNVASFMTGCDGITITEANPWVDDFEGYPGSGTIGIGECWARPVTASASNGTFPSVYAGYSGSAYSGANTVEFKGASNMLVLPAFTNAMNTLEMTFWANTTAYNASTAGTMELGVITDLEDPTTFTVVEEIPATAFNRTGQDAPHANFVGPISFAGVVPQEGQRIAFRYSNPSNTYQSWNLDDFVVSIIQECQVPTNVTITNITTNSANVAWTAGGEETTWQIQCGPAGFVPGLVPALTLDSNHYALTELAENTSYDIYVKAVCDENTQSVWVGPYTFTTNETPAPELPCDNSCEYTVVLTDTYGNGWTDVNWATDEEMVGALVIAQNDQVYYTLSMTEEDGETVSHQVALCDSLPTMLTLIPCYWAEEMGVAVYNPAGELVWQFEPNTFEGFGDDDPVVFNFTAACPVLIPCYQPNNLVVSQLTDTTAQLTWEGDTTTAYKVYYGPMTETTPTVITVTGTEITLTGLTPNVTYQAYVQALCDNIGIYSNVVTFFPTQYSINCAELTVGEEDRSEYYMPLNNYYKNSYSQQIFTSSEIGMNGFIDKISFHYAHTSAMTKKNNVKIYLGHTGKETFANSSDWITTGLVQVYEGSLNCTEGWNEFVLDQAFAYNGVDNLVVVVEDNSNGYDGSSYKFYQTNVEGNKAISWQNDYSTWSASNSGTLRTYRSDIRFNICSSSTDIAVVSMAKIPNSCDLSNVPVSVGLFNFGDDLESGTPIEMYYSVNGAAPVHETFVLADALISNWNYSYVFNTYANLTEPSNVITVWAEIIGDGNSQNNKISSDTIRIVEPATIPFLETFNDGEIHDGWNTYRLTDAGLMLNVNHPGITISEGMYYNESLPILNFYTLSPCMYIPAGRYDVAYSYKAMDMSIPEAFEVYMCAQTDNGLTLVQQVSSEAFSNTEMARSHNFITVAESGVYYFAIHSVSPTQHIGFNVDNFAVKEAINFTAYYAEHGTGTPEGQVEVAKDELYTLTIVPDPGYHVEAIYKNMQLVSGENADNAMIQYYTFVPQNGDNIYVTFTTSSFEVNATVDNLDYTEYNNNAIGAVYTPNHQTVAYGGSHTGLITVAEHYHIGSVTVNGLDVTSTLVPVNETQYALTINNIVENKNIHVVAALDSTVIVYTVLGGQGVINGEFEVDATTPLPAVYTVTLPGYSDLLSTIYPAPGYSVSSIIVDGVEHNVIDMYSFEHLFGYHTVEVIFSTNHYTITTTSFGNGTVSDGVEFEYDPDFTYVFSATPDPGYRIGNILRNNVELTIPNPSEGYTETLENITSDIHYEVIFIQDKYAVSATSGAHGTVSPAGVSYYFHNQDVVYDITAEPGYYISSLTVDGETTTYTQESAVTSTTYLFEQIHADHTISATFGQYMFNVTVNAGANGSIILVNPASAPFAYGSTPTYAIIPNEGYAIVDVTVDNVSVGAVTSYTFTALTANHTIAATFTENLLTITADAGNGGTISDAGVNTVSYNGTKTFTITPNAGYHVEDVYVDGASVGPVTSYTFNNVVANHAIYAAFAANEYTITVTQPANGVITPGTTTVLNGATPAFMITPTLGYSVSAITVNGVNVISNATNVNDVYTYVFPPVSTNQTITATMTAKTFTITATAGANGSITPNGSVTVYYGNTQEYNINPANGYVVDNVVVDGINMGAMNSYIFTNVVANHSINVTFKPAECEIPTFLYTTHIDSTSAELHWSHPTATSFDIQYKTPTGTITSVPSIAGTSYLLTDLTPGTTYLWQVRANCSASNHSEWSNMVTFTTDNTTIDETGIEDHVKNQVKVYAERQNVHIVNVTDVNIDNVRIFDAYGKLLYSGSVYSNHEVINLNVAAGTYIVNVTTDEGVANYKVVLMK
ncbi:MAG: fibronectin type III domain-containing protein [Bacteroidales bacterium]|nr:fibronectin type III domain-containing protein [Bacteroidales bacterium]